MKKEARNEALKVFLKSKGKFNNKQIAEKVGVNPLTIGRWKREDNWQQTLEEKLAEAAREAAHAGEVVRKKAQRDAALKLFLESGGRITNKEMAKTVGVSPATIAKWKNVENWPEQVAAAPAAPAAPVVAASEAASEAVPAEAKAELELDMGDLVSPEQIIRINQRIDVMLERDYLTAEDIADLAEAKREALEAVEIYLGIVRELGLLPE
ncbi:MAG: hypothetical protein LDL33_13895 [Desulfomonile sp.]|nr:hypothetical protein [Desulfomonile sp.]